MNRNIHNIIHNLVLIKRIPLFLNLNLKILRVIPMQDCSY